MTNTQIAALRGAAVLWVIWGLVHTFAGVMLLASDTSGAAIILSFWVWFYNRGADN